MKIDKAIERLKIEADLLRAQGFDIREQAARLGIEAMKEIRRNRPVFLTNVHLLPGETK